MIESSSHSGAGDGSGANSALRAKINELELELREEKDRLIVEQSQAEVAKFVARQEVDKCRRECSALQDRVARLEEDCGMLRKMEAKDQERIKRLVEEIEAKERDFQEMFIEMKVEIRDLQCGKNRAVAKVAQWRRRCEDLIEEVSRLRRGEMVVAGEIEEEMPLRNEGHLSTPERKRSSVFLGAGNESESMGEDGADGGDDEDERIPLSQLKKRRVTEVGDGVGKGSGCGEPTEDENAGTRNAEPAGTSAEVADAQIPSCPSLATGKQEV